MLNKLLLLAVENKAIYYFTENEVAKFSNSIIALCIMAIIAALFLAFSVIVFIITHKKSSGDYILRKKKFGDFTNKDK